MKELIPVLLSHPNEIPYFIQDDFFDKDTSKKLNIVYELYIKNKKLISLDLAKKTFGIESLDYNESDLDFAFHKLEQWNLLNFVSKLDINDPSWEEIETLKNKYQKTYRNKEHSSTLFNSHEDIENIYNDFEKTVVNTISSGFPNFDSMLNEQKGWMRKGLYSIMGLSGFGKSIFLINFARGSFQQNQKVLYISTEMTEPEINERFFKSLTNKTTFQEACLQIKKYKLKYDGSFQVIKINPYDMTVADCQNIISKLDYKPDIIYIDYADELLSDMKVNSEYDAQGNIYSRLKKLANDLDVPIVTATQTNRTAEGENGGTKTYIGFGAIADSSKKIRLVDGLFSIIQQTGDKAENKIYLQVVKNRKAKSGEMLEFSINYSTMRINEFGIMSVKDAINKKRSINKEEKSMRNMMTDVKQFEEKLNVDEIINRLDNYKTPKGGRK